MQRVKLGAIPNGFPRDIHDHPGLAPFDTTDPLGRDEHPPPPAGQPVVCIHDQEAQGPRSIVLFGATPPLGRVELEGTGNAYLEEHRVSHKTVKYDCSKCDAEGGGAGPVGDVLNLVGQENIDLVVMGGTRRGYFGRMLWPEMAYEVAWNIEVPLLIWY